MKREIDGSSPARTRELFRKWVAAHGGDGTVATILGTSRGTVSNLRNGHSRPSLMLAFTIERLTRRQIRCSDWISVIEGPA